MRPGQEVRWGPARVQRRLIEIAGDRVERFGAEEPAGGDLRQPVRTQRISQRRAALVDGAGMVDRPVALAAAGLVIASQRADRLKKRFREEIVRELGPDVQTAWR